MPGNVEKTGFRVRVAWSGNAPAERVKTTPITAKPGEKPQVVISFGRAQNPEVSLPDLEPGDELEIGVELEVTTDLTPKQAEENARDGGKPTGKPYDYAPAVTAQLLLCNDADVTAPGNGRAVRIGDQERLKLSHEQHHGLLVFSRTFTVPREGLPWAGGARINLVVGADNPEAETGHVLLVGQNEFNGAVETDMSSVCAIRLRPAAKRGSAETIRDLALKSLPISDEQWKVVASVRLNGLRERQQLLARAQLKASAKKAGCVGRLKTRLFLADSPGQKEPDGKSYAASISSSTGHLTKANGSNCLPADNETTFRKVGILEILRDANKPVYLNLAAQAGNPEKAERPGDLALIAAELSVLKFEPNQFG